VIFALVLPHILLISLVASEPFWFKTRVVKTLLVAKGERRD